MSAAAPPPLDPSYTIQSFPAGSGPAYLAFDGANIWVTDYGVPYKVTKLRASDGELLGAFPVAPNPAHLAFDGVNIWVASDNGHTITKFRASDGPVLGIFPTGNDLPRGIA